MLTAGRLAAFEIVEQSYLFPELIPLGWVRVAGAARRRPTEGEAEYRPVQTSQRDPLPGEQRDQSGAPIRPGRDLALRGSSAADG